MIEARALLNTRLILDEPYIIREARCTHATPERGDQRVFIDGIATPPCTACGEAFPFHVALTVDELGGGHDRAVNAVIEAIQGQYERTQKAG